MAAARRFLSSRDQALRDYRDQGPHVMPSSSSVMCAPFISSVGVKPLVVKRDSVAVSADPEADAEAASYSAPCIFPRISNQKSGELSACERSNSGARFCCSWRFVCQRRTELVRRHIYKCSVLFRSWRCRLRRLPTIHHRLVPSDPF